MLLGRVLISIYASPQQDAPPQAQQPQQVKQLQYIQQPQPIIKPTSPVSLSSTLPISSYSAAAASPTFGPSSSSNLKMKAKNFKYIGEGSRQDGLDCRIVLCENRQCHFCFLKLKSNAAYEAHIATCLTQRKDYPSNLCPLISDRSSGTHFRTCRGINGIPFVPNKEHHEYWSNWLKLGIKEELKSISNFSEPSY